MPIVFVHGVNNRDSPEYQARKDLIEKFLLRTWDGKDIGDRALTPVSVSFPYWGNLGATFAWNQACLPTSTINTLGAPGIPEELRPILAEAIEQIDVSAPDSETLTRISKSQSLRDAVRLLTAAIVQSTVANDPEVVRTQGPANDFLVRAQMYAEDLYARGVAPPWLDAVKTDEQWMTELGAAVDADPAVQALGLAGAANAALSAGIDAIKSGLENLRRTGAAIVDRAARLASTRLVAWGRPMLNAELGRFFGDIFVYLDTRGDKVNPGPIPRFLLDAIRAAQRACPNEPLVLMGHSLGGVILFDILTHFDPNIEPDVFITVGSQVSLFEEIKRFRSSDAAIHIPALAPVPKNIRRWINVLDPVDVFSYACERVFDRVVDFQYDTGAHVLRAHGAYFEQADFYVRVRNRI